jgi:hypothetical protein
MILAGVILLLLFSPKRSGFAGGQAGPSGANVYMNGVGDSSYNLIPADYASAGGAGSSPDVVSSASLIPRDVIQTEDFGQFSPDKILGNQNYLDPRSQIGYPETVGGVLRNANRQFRSEPTNPRSPVSIFNLSTIPPDTMRPKFEISPEYQ